MCSIPANILTILVPMVNASTWREWKTLWYLYHSGKITHYTKGSYFYLSSCLCYISILECFVLHKPSVVVSSTAGSIWSCPTQRTPRTPHLSGRIQQAQFDEAEGPATHSETFTVSTKLPLLQTLLLLQRWCLFCFAVLRSTKIWAVT